MMCIPINHISVIAPAVAAAPSRSSTLELASRLRVTNEMMQLVQKNHRVADKWTVLAHSLGLSRHVMDIRIRVNMYGEANSMCILYLLQEWVGAVSKKATLGHLLKVLREQDFNDIADVLEEKFT
ncbi:Uncharacterized protein GBIM_02256 [Gryllus bimaculatus]|nr:Uncharacterized protein GBIM_02256 [Gryllus bimaculatus]